MKQLPSLAVIVDGQKILHYDRNNSLPKEQMDYLDKMDEKMNQGISFGTQQFTSPGKEERAQYVANTLISALSNNDDGLAAATCAWLAVRLPDLQQVKSKVKDDHNMIELIFDRSFDQSDQEQVISFKPMH
jgi:glycine/serine hydroxymethyltransferase